MAEINIELNRFNGTSNDALLPQNSLTGATDPTTSTVGIVGQFYLNTTNRNIYICTKITDSVYTWKNSRGLSPQIDLTVATDSTEEITATCTDGTITLTTTCVNKQCSFVIPRFGTWTVSAVVYGKTFYSQPIIVDTAKIYKTQLLGLDSTLNNNTWEQIKTASDLSIGANYWAIGDAKQITLSGAIGDTNVDGQSYWVYILGFNHNASVEGDNRIHFGFGRSEQNYSDTNGIALTDASYLLRPSFIGAFTMNTTENSDGGWNNCHMRNVIIGSGNNPSSPTANTFMSALPSNLRAVMKSCQKWSDNVGGQSGDESDNVTATTDYVWLLAEYEVYGMRDYANLYEQQHQAQYQYYVNGNTRKKYSSRKIGDNCLWWLRSLYHTYACRFCCVSTSTNDPISYYYANFSFGVAPAFCV